MPDWGAEIPHFHKGLLHPALIANCRQLYRNGARALRELLGTFPNLQAVRQRRGFGVMWLRACRRVLSLRKAGRGAEKRAPDGGAWIEVLDAPTGRWCWPDDLKARVVAESFQSGARICDVAANARLLSGWHVQAHKGELILPVGMAPAFVPLIGPFAAAATAAESTGTCVITV